MGLDIFFMKAVTKPHFKKKRRKEAKTNFSIRYHIGYFRKLNALYNWVNNHMGPIGNCQDVYLYKQDIEDLHNTLEKLDESNCHELFPTCTGFFFGSQDYDDWYWSDIEDLKAFIRKTLKNLKDPERETIIFHAWY